MDFLKFIKQDLVLFDNQFKTALSSKATLLRKVTLYLNKQAGKKIRPICTIIAAGLCGTIQDKTYRGAVLVELLHTATLIHDDIVDDAYLRRNQFSINAIWKNKVAVLIGDYFLAKGLKLAVSSKDFDFLYLMSDVVQKIVEGELIQIEKTKKLNLKEQEYLKIIELKTGSLFQSSFAAGAVSVGANSKTLEIMSQVGLKIGLIFQIKDDILDYPTKSKKSGKKMGNDIQEGKINLPLLSAINKMKFNEKRHVYSILRKKTNNAAEIKFVQDLVFLYRGIEYAESLISKYYNEVISLISSFENNQYKESLLSLLKYLMIRSK